MPLGLHRALLASGVPQSIANSLRDAPRRGKNRFHKSFRGNSSIHLRNYSFSVNPSARIYRYFAGAPRRLRGSREVPAKSTRPTKKPPGPEEVPGGWRVKGNVVSSFQVRGRKRQSHTSTVDNRRSAERSFATADLRARRSLAAHNRTSLRRQAMGLRLEGPRSRTYSPAPPAILSGGLCTAALLSD